ncbi:MAG TPA: hypothetical protein VLT13_07295, partial [Bacteroidota bacterium]|nr:hypothetical protein [Bacteroidota bacterium]
MTRSRQDHAPPPVIARRGWKFHHLGIPTTVPHAGEKHLDRLKMFVRGFDSSPFGIEWMRFEPGCQISELVRTVPHVAFEVKNLERALRGFTPLGEISSPSRGTRVAMIVADGAPIELIEFSRARRKVRG